LSFSGTLIARTAAEPRLRLVSTAHCGNNERENKMSCMRLEEVEHQARKM
jgi:hypothetical protein